MVSETITLQSIQQQSQTLNTHKMIWLNDWEKELNEPVIPTFPNILVGPYIAVVLHTTNISIHLLWKTNSEIILYVWYKTLTWNGKVERKCVPYVWHKYALNLLYIQHKMSKTITLFSEKKSKLTVSPCPWTSHQGEFT